MRCNLDLRPATANLLKVVDLDVRKGPVGKTTVRIWEGANRAYGSMVERSRLGKKGVRFPSVHKLNIYSMERSESIKEIANALCKFQQEVGKIKKSANNPFFKSKYATLSDILDVIQEPLSNSGLSVMQLPTGENELETIVMHISGEFIASKYTMRPTKNDPQGIGSCITYQRRYALGAALSLNIDEDDDGNKASQNTISKPSNSNQKKILTSEHLNNKDSMDSMCKWIYKNASEAQKNKQRFSIAALIENNYKVTSVEVNTISEIYEQYKINNNLP